MKIIKIAFVAAFLLTVATYAAFLWLQPSVPLGAAEVTVVFGIWLVLAAITVWLFGKFRKRTTKNGH